MSRTTKLWSLLGATLLIAFFLLGFFGREVYRQAPPLPERVVTEDGATLMTKDSILDGQQVWQSTGGQQLGSIWGHGAYQAPDWSADWLHRECVALLDLWAGKPVAGAPGAGAGLSPSDDDADTGESRPDQTAFASGGSYRDLPAESQAALRERLRQEMRTNRYDPATRVLTVSRERGAAIAATAAHYAALYGGDPALASLREDYAMQDAAVTDATRLDALTDFFFWTSWACATERPGSNVTYTNNWPHEPLIGNRPTGANIVWSLISIILLLGGIGALVWWRAFRSSPEESGPAPQSSTSRTRGAAGRAVAPSPAPESAANPHRYQAPWEDPLAQLTLTPSMRAVGKYLFVVIAVFGLQVLLGALTAHYTVEGQHFFGLPLAEWFPYSLTRTWHIQTAVFWIATAFLAAGLFLAPAVGGREPRFQRLGVNVLFGALLLVVGGSLAGEFLSIHQELGLDTGFWFGHQGYEYVDLGRAWQIALFVGLVLWLGLMLRGLWPALRRRDESRTLVLMFAGASAAIGLMYGAGFFFSARSHLSVMEYWRWWVVHLWVEGFFEVFATAALAFLFSRLGLVQPKHAGHAVVASSALFLLGGIPGTFHHLYFSGTPTSVMAIGATFSALEVIPLVLVGLEAFETYRMQYAASWVLRYRWPIRFFLAVAFWNLVGAGLFGFLINPPIALYYAQGLNTTPVHAHTALFGVYGLLALGLTLVTARLLARRPWREGALAYSFWAMNVGLALMVGMSILPIGLAQVSASVEHGLWFARSAEFLQQPTLETLRWLRIVGDTVFLSGVAALAWFFLGLLRGWSYAPAQSEGRAGANSGAGRGTPGVSFEGAPATARAARPVNAPAPGKNPTLARPARAGHRS